MLFRQSTNSGKKTAYAVRAEINNKANPLTIAHFPSKSPVRPEFTAGNVPCSAFGLFFLPRARAPNRTKSKHSAACHVTIRRNLSVYHRVTPVRGPESHTGGRKSPASSLCCRRGPTVPRTKRLHSRAARSRHRQCGTHRPPKPSGRATAAPGADRGTGRDEPWVMPAHPCLGAAAFQPDGTTADCFGHACGRRQFRVGVEPAAGFQAVDSTWPSPDSRKTCVSRIPSAPAAGLRPPSRAAVPRQVPRRSLPSAWPRPAPGRTVRRCRPACRRAPREHA